MSLCSREVAAVRANGGLSDDKEVTVGIEVNCGPYTLEASNGILGMADQIGRGQIQALSEVETADALS